MSNNATKTEVKNLLLNDIRDAENAEARNLAVANFEMFVRAVSGEDHMKLEKKRFDHAVKNPQ